MNLKEFGFFVADIREKSGFKSQRQLSLASGVSNGTIARIESGTQKPTPETLSILSKHLSATTYEELMKNAGYLDAERISEAKFESLVMEIGRTEETNDAETTIRLIEEQAKLMGMKSSDPSFQEILLNAFELIRLARRKDSQ